jgi:hypothetical protein
MSETGDVDTNVDAARLEAYATKADAYKLS